MANFAAEISHPTDNDVSWVIQNIENYLIDPFVAPNVRILFEMTPWALIARQAGEIIAYAAFVDYPYQDHWSNEWYALVKEDWESSKYCSLNSIFLHVIVCKSDLKQLLKEMLRVTFLSIPSLQFCCILVLKHQQLNTDLQALFERNELMETGGHEFWTAQRDAYIPKVGIRNKLSEDYLELKTLFSRIYGPFKNDELQKFTLDFLDYGEDRMATYKYFTFDDDNTFVGIAENDVGKAVGLIYATIQRVDLDSLNRLFQLESVYGLRKRHPDDDPGIDFTRDDQPVSEESCDEEDEVREVVANLVDEIVTDFEVNSCMKDLVDDVCEAQRRHRRRTEFNLDVEDLHCPTFLNSREFDLSNPVHLRLVTRQNVRHFTPATLLRLVNSDSFDPKRHVHMKLIPLLGKHIAEVEETRLKEILNSDLFDPGLEEYSMMCVHVMSHLPESKLERFQKSTVGYQIYEKLMYRLALEKQDAILKTKKIKHAPKLSFKDAQIILHHTKGLKQKEHVKKSSVANKISNDTDSWKRVSYRNMGFISGLTCRNQYRAQDNFVDAKTGLASDNENSKEPGEKIHHEVNVSEKYPISSFMKSLRILQEIPIYNGGTNCFHIEQFAIERKYESQSLRLLAAAFAYFPRVDYCMVLLPYGTRQVSYLRQYFCNIPARPFIPCDKELFVLHKASLSASYKIRPYNNEFSEVQKLISGSCLKDYLLKDLESNADSNKIKSIVLESDRKVFGIAIIQDLKEVETIRRKCDVSERINMKYHKNANQGLLLHCVLHPIFKSLAKVFLNEVMKLSGKSILYYKIYPTHLIPLDPSRWQSLCNVLEQLSPLKPFQRPSKSFIVLKDSTANKTENEEDKNDDKYYCLAYTCTKIVLRNTNVNSSRIVVFGDSDIALGVLESLIYSDKFKFTNLTIVTKYGIRGEYNLDSKCHHFLPMSMNYAKPVLDGICLPVWVTVVRGELLSIKRSKLILQEMSGAKQNFVCNYDFLVICCDLEFQPLSLNANADSEEPCPSRNLQYPLLKNLYKGRVTVGKHPSNVFTVNNEQEAALVLNWLWKYFTNKVESRKQTKKRYKSLAERERDKREGRIVIYGNFLEAYSALAVIIGENFPLSKITFIKPKSSSCPFFTERVEEAVDKIISKTEVDLILDASVEYDKSAMEVLTLEVTTSRGLSRLDCCALLLFNEKKINYNTFTSLHKSPLAFTLPLSKTEGSPFLLVKRNFLTNVRNVFAAGTVAAVHTDQREIIRLDDCVYNEREMGMVVGKSLNDLVSGDLQNANNLPNLSRPKVTYVKLPCTYYYILINSPSLMFKPASDEVTENAVERLVLGNLNTGSAGVPMLAIHEIVNDVEESENSDEALDCPNPEQNVEATELTAVNDEIKQKVQNVHSDIKDDSDFHEIEKFTEDEVEEPESKNSNKPLPEDPEYFALSFDKNESITTIECLTNKNVDVIVLKNLFEVRASQLFKILQKVGDQGASTVSFRLTENWILPLDYVMFEDEKGRGYRYEGYWREGYPEHIKTRLNSFLDSFVDRKKK